MGTIPLWAYFATCFLMYWLGRWSERWLARERRILTDDGLTQIGELLPKDIKYYCPDCGQAFFVSRRWSGDFGPMLKCTKHHPNVPMIQVMEGSP